MTGADGAVAHDDRRPVEPTLVGRRVELLPVTAQHYDFLLDLEWSADRVAFNRFRGITPSPDAFVNAVWGAVAANFLVMESSSRMPLGLVVLHNLDSRNGNAHVSVVSTRHDDSGLGVMEGLALLIDYAFKLWPLRKLYAEVAEPNLRHFRSAVDVVFEVEGHLKGHYFFDGQHWDQYILSLTREHWDDVVSDYRDLLGIGRS